MSDSKYVVFLPEYILNHDSVKTLQWQRMVELIEGENEIIVLIIERFKGFPWSPVILLHAPG